MRLFPLINLVCTPHVPYLVMFSPISDSVLMPDALEPPFHLPSSASNACMSAWNFSYALLFLLMCSSEFTLGRYLVPHSLGQPRLIDLVSIRPPLSISSYLTVGTMKTPMEG